MNIQSGYPKSVEELKEEALYSSNGYAYWLNHESKAYHEARVIDSRVYVRTLDCKSYCYKKADGEFSERLFKIHCKKHGFNHNL